MSQTADFVTIFTSTCQDLLLSSQCHQQHLLCRVSISEGVQKAAVLAKSTLRREHADGYGQQQALDSCVANGFQPQVDACYQYL